MVIQPKAHGGLHLLDIPREIVGNRRRDMDQNQWGGFHIELPSGYVGQRVEARVIRKMREGVDYVVVWSGRDELLPPREEHPDNRIASMPGMDWDEETKPVTAQPKRKYTRTGRYARPTVHTAVSEEIVSDEGTTRTSPTAS